MQNNSVKVTDECIACAKHFGLTREELERFITCLQRLPSAEELAIAGAMWSEHCSYKSSRVHLKKLHTQEPWVVQGPGENAGIIAINNNWCLAFKMESHNHPSAIEPYQGAATGVGGILRDVFCMGARPIANINCLRFGTDARTPHLVKGCVEGIGDYGNSVGVPTVCGQTHFDGRYSENILVNAFSAGIVHKDAIFRGIVAKDVSETTPVTLTPETPVASLQNEVLYPPNENILIYFGSATGRDGVHGATMSSSEFSGAAQGLRPTVQVGDPFAEKQVMEATLALIASGRVVGLQDMGAAGLTSSGIEMAARSRCGVTLDLDKVPKRASHMKAWEILLSESQERMLCAVAPHDVEAVCEILKRFDLPFAVVGQVNRTGHFVCLFENKICAALPVAAFEEATPRYEHALEDRASYLNRHSHLTNSEKPREHELRAYESAVDNANIESFVSSHKQAIESLLVHPNFCSRYPLYNHYCSTVQGNTLAGSGALQDAAAALLRLPIESQEQSDGRQGIALAAGCEELWIERDPRHGTALSMLALARKIVAAGGVPKAVSDCLNFGSMQHPAVARQFSDAIDGINDIATHFAIPVVSGNVSLNNQTQGRAIPPTPMLGMVGTVDDIANTSLSVLPWKFFVRHSPQVTLYEIIDESVQNDSFRSSPVAWQWGGRNEGALPQYTVENEKRMWKALKQMHMELNPRICLPIARAGLFVTLFKLVTQNNAHIILEKILFERSAASLFTAGSSHYVAGFDQETQGDLLQTLFLNAGFTMRKIGTLLEKREQKTPSSQLENFLNDTRLQCRWQDAMKPYFKKTRD